MQKKICIAQKTNTEDIGFRYSNRSQICEREEHRMQMKILEGKLKQEEIKTELLKLQMQRDAGMDIE